MPALQLKSANRFLWEKQHLTASTRATDAMRVVRDICALHATAGTTPYLALRARCRAFAREQLETALYSTRTLARIMCMRTTMHIVPTDEVPVFFQATNERPRREHERGIALLLLLSGLCQEGEEEETLARIEARIMRALRERGPSTVAELSELVPEMNAKFRYSPDKPYGGQYSVGSYLVRGMATAGVLVRANRRGTWRSTQHDYAPFDEWLPEIRLDELTRVEAQRHLVRAYLRSFGPATFDDARWWTGFGKRETTQALTALGEDVTEVAIEGLGDAYLMLADEVERILEVDPWSGTQVVLLPSLDPLIMGYSDRSRFLPPERLHRVFDRAGNAMATVWANGRIVGVWQEQDGRVELLTWGGVDPGLLAAEGRRLAFFLYADEDAVTVQPYPPDGYAKSPFSVGRRRQA